MALQKNYTNAAGIEMPTSYHRLLNSELKRRVGNDGSVLQSATGIMQIWKDATSREQGLAPVQSLQFDITGGDYTSYFGVPTLDQTNVNVMASMYDWVKTQSDIQGINYTDSTDV